MSEARRYDVVIIGAGIAGSSLAAALSGCGLSIALVEAQSVDGSELPQERDAHSFDPRVSALTPKSQAFLQQLDAWQQIIDYRACPYGHMTVWDAEGTGRIDFDCTEVDRSVLGHIVENRAIVKSLMSAVSAASDVTLHCPAALADCDFALDGRLHLVLEDGGLLEARLMVAADGALSRVRNMLDFATREWDYGHRAIACTIQVERAHEHTAWQRFLATGPLALLPLPGTHEAHFCSIVWSATNDLADSLMALSDDAFCDALEDASERCLGRVLKASKRSCFPLRQRHAIDYVQPGVALVGDAAHTIHPLAGQGINLGLRDVAVLAEEIERALGRGENVGDLEVLQRFQRRRKGDNLLMMTAMDGFKRLFEQRAPAIRWLRNAGMSHLDRLLPVKQQLIKHAMGVD
ncbi:MAG: UbiH/UbiF/VisC/COQ6 family ubiquinone biosynthesis hydroxylase [Pseudomonadota bacterium]